MHLHPPESRSGGSGAGEKACRYFGAAVAYRNIDGRCAVIYSLFCWEGVPGKRVVLLQMILLILLYKWTAIKRLPKKGQIQFAIKLRLNVYNEVDYLIRHVYLLSYILWIVRNWNHCNHLKTKDHLGNLCKFYGVFTVFLFWLLFLQQNALLLSPRYLKRIRAHGVHCKGKRDWLDHILT